MMKRFVILFILFLIAIGAITINKLFIKSSKPLEITSTPEETPTTKVAIPTSAPRLSTPKPILEPPVKVAEDKPSETMEDAQTYADSGDLKKAVLIWGKFASQGDSDAQWRLGSCYISGLVHARY
jgi:hypothetical protein